jgi:hypothetical protein
MDVTDMTHLYLDFWTPNMTTFRVKLVDFGSDGIYGGGNDTEHELTYTPTLENWINLDIPLSSFTNLAARNNIAQLIFSGNPAGSGVVYVDNVLFHTTSSGLGENDANNVHVFPNPANEFLFISGTSELESVRIFDLNGKLVLSDEMIGNKCNISSLNQGAYIVITELQSGEVQRHRIIKE